MSDIKNILSKLDMLSEQIGFRPGARDFSGQRIEPKFDFSPVQDIAPPMGAVGGTAKPRIKVQPGQSPRQAISKAQEKIPTLKIEVPRADSSVDPYGRLEPKLGDISKQQSFVGKRKDPGGPLPAASKSIEPTLEMNKFPGYLKGTDTAKDVEKKMVGMEEGSAATLAGQTLAKKAASKIIPGVGTALSYKDAWDRWQKGDKVGAAMAGAAGTAFLVPGPGTAVGTALDAANIGRDIKAGEYDDLFKEENVLKKKNKKHDAEIDEALVGDAIKYGARGIKTGADWFRNLFTRDKGITPVTPIPNRPAASGTARPASGTTQSPGTAAGTTKPGNTDNVVDVDVRDVTDRQVPAVRQATPVAVRPVAAPRPPVPFKKPAPVPPWRAAVTGATAGLATGVLSGDSEKTTRNSAGTSDSAVVSTPVPPRDTVVTVDTQADPERPFAAPPPGSRFRAPAGASIPTRDFDTGGSALGSDFESRTTPSTPQGFQFSPEQEEWLARRGGNPNRQDPYILSRMLKKAGGPIPPLSYFTNQEDREIAKRLGFPEVPLEESYSKSVNRLIRKFENYLDNRFDIVENNYIPKKKNLG